MSSFSRNPSDLETSHGLANRRDLLPYETELCNTVGISPEEYFEFLAQANSTVVTREGYEHIPDVQCEITTTTLAIVQLVVGLALTAASLLMSPKPRGSDDERVDIKRPDQIGRNRFTPTFAFDTVQELARLGQTVPIVFADQLPLTASQQEDADSSVLRGGTRANSLLTFSMLSSTGGSQRLRVYGVAGFSGRERNLFAAVPDYDGLAFGDQLIRDYNPGRIAAYFRGQVVQEGVTNDGPIQAGDKYQLQGIDYQFVPPVGDPSLVYWHNSGTFEKAFSGARNPANESEFGAYSPMPNGNYWKVDFQMFILPDAAESRDKERVGSIRSKISSPFPVYAAITSIKGNKVTYRIDQRNDDWDNLFDSNGDVNGEDIANQVNQQRLNIDASLVEGGTYLLNNQVGILTTKTPEPFDAGSRGVICEFTMTQDGEGAPPTKMDNDTDGNKIEDREPYGRGVKHWDKDANQIQKFSDAIIANNVACDCTEIGIGSTVWKRFQGSNVNNWPGREFVNDLENNDAGGTFDMGRMDCYVTRYSFFHIQMRRQGEISWGENVNGGGVFAVKGNTPVERFNAIRIYHTRGQYEYRMRPYPSKLAYYRHKDNDKKIYLLNAKKGLDDRSAQVYRIEDTPEGFDVYFEGNSIQLNDEGLVTNKESIKGEQGADNFDYKVTSVTPTVWKPEADLGTGLWPNDPENNNPRYNGPTYANPATVNCGTKVLRRVFHNENNQRWVFYWEGAKVADLSLPGTGMPSREDLIGYQRFFNDSTCAKVVDDDNVRYQPSNLSTPRYSKPRDASGKEIFLYDISRKKRVRNLTVKNRETARAIGGSGSGLTFDLVEYNDGSFSWTIKEKGEGYRDGDQVRLNEISENGFKIVLQATATPSTDGSKDPGWDNVGDTAPLSMITDYYHRNVESSSHKDRPEHRVTYVNEFVLAPDTVDHGTYRNLASVGFILNSSKQLTSLTQLSAYYQQGLRIEKLGKDYAPGTIGASNIFPEIAWFILTDSTTGAGGIINKEQLDRESFSRAADYCRANQYYWDGVLDERVNLRQFIHEQASYCLLDFTMKGGRFGFEPTVPVNTDLTLKTNDDAIPEIKALFTDGNIREMQVTTLPPEERKLFEADMLYREERINQFPQTRSTTLRLARYPDALATETYDLTQFCTSRRQAVNFAKYALKARQWIDHVIEFQTTPQSMSNVEPGDYIRVISHLCHPDRFATGHINAEGVIQSSQEITSGTQVYYWNPSFTKDAATNSFIRVGTIQIGSDGKAQNALRGCVFAVVSSTTSNRVYKVDSIGIGEEGFVSVTGTHMPVGGQGQLKVMTGWDESRDFEVNSSVYS